MVPSLDQGCSAEWVLPIDPQSRRAAFVVLVTARYNFLGAIFCMKLGIKNFKFELLVKVTRA